jgi:hypothetical protein
VFVPDANEDYLVVSGEANTVLSTLIERMGLQFMFNVSSESSGIDISYKMNRYVKGYTGILKMLKATSVWQMLSSNTSAQNFLSAVCNATSPTQQ